MPPAFVQATGNASGATAGTTLAASFGSNTAPGNLLVVGGGGNAADTYTITDTLGLTWNTAVAHAFDAASAYQASIFYAVTPGGADTITLHSPASPQFRRLWIHEYSGCDTFDKGSSALGSSTLLTTTTPATTVADELVFGLGISFSGITAAGSGYTLRSTQGSESSEDKTVSSTGAQTVTFATASSAWMCLAATFYASVAGGIPDLVMAPPRR